MAKRIEKLEMIKHPVFKNQYTGVRIKKANIGIDNKVNPFPNAKGIQRSIGSIDFQEKYISLEKGETSSDGEEYTLIGKISLHRKMSKLGFIKIDDPLGRVQGIYSLEDTPSYSDIKATIDIGDIISMTGIAYRTSPNEGDGEITLKIKEFSMVTKSLAAPIGKHAGLTDPETKFRKRYLDMIANPDVRDNLITRSNVISTIRKFMEKEGILEVETPMMHAIPGGANAKPFTTFHNAMGVERYLRIAPELYLKRLLVGGMENVFEINRNFRNEGVDATHNPEFTSIEFYQAYKTYKDHMKMTEKLFKKIYRKVFGNKDYVLPYGEQEINLNNWSRIPFREALLTIGDIPEDVIDEVEPLSMYLREQGSEKANATMPLGKLWEIAFDDFVEEKLVDPTFITEYPADISPLARRMDKNPDLTERFELFVAGRELANGFNELNDPLDQFRRFSAQVDGKDLEDEDDESMHMDEDFIEALMNGMPPSAGTGIGIDRLVMLFTNTHTIRDIIAFPAMK